MHPDTLAAIEDNTDHNAAFLVWVHARNRETGAPEAAGFWTGDDHQQFTIDGDPRVYFGAGSVIQVGDIRYAPGLVIEMHQIELTIQAEHEALFLTHDPALQPVEIHLARFHPGTLILTGAPDRVFLGTVDDALFEDGPVAGTRVIKMNSAPSARALTATVALRKSHVALATRSSGDAFRQYAGLPGRDVKWGEP